MSSEETMKIVEPVYLNSFFKCLEKVQPKRIAIFTHAFPDPDAIGSIMSMNWFLHKLYPDVEITGFFDGSISHPQNVAMMSLLNPNIRPITEYTNDNFDFRILVDTVPAHAGVGGNQVSFNIVVDHHKEIPNGGFNGVFINEHTGSCCGMIYNLIKNSNILFNEDVDEDSNVATALLVGVITDTENLMSDDTGEHEFKAYEDLFKFRNTDALKRIIKFKLPISWSTIRGRAALDHEIKDGVAVVGLGMLEDKQRDVIAYVADDISRLDGVETSVVYAVFNGNRIEGSVRSSNASVDVPALSKKLAGKSGCGGGKASKGSYSIPLTGVDCDDQDSEDVKKSLWELINTKERSKIFRTSKK